MRFEIPVRIIGSRLQEPVKFVIVTDAADANAAQIGVGLELGKLVSSFVTDVTVGAAVPDSFAISAPEQTGSMDKIPRGWRRVKTGCVMSGDWQWRRDEKGWVAAPERDIHFPANGFYCIIRRIEEAAPAELTAAETLEALTDTQ
jgi:hypothetical protein